MTPTKEAIEACLAVLEALVQEPLHLNQVDADTHRRLMVAAGRVSRPTREERKSFARALFQQEKQARRAADEATLARTGMRKQRLLPVFVTPEPALLAAAEGGTAATLEGAAQFAAADFSAALDAPPLHTPLSCYICKRRVETVHTFYDQMCPECGDFNYRKRTQTADLRGRVAYISGARVKIGYQAAILLLRAGATVIVSTRFPRDAALRYAREKDYEDWRERLQVYGLDLRHTPSVEAFARHLEQSLPRLDFVLHNACQTVRRPVGYYSHLMQAEGLPYSELPAATRPLLAEHERLRASGASQAVQAALAAPFALLESASMSQVPLTSEDLRVGEEWFPSGKLDEDLQQVDLRAINSWRLALDQVSTVELLEVQLVNAIAPFVLNARLRALLTREKTYDKHIVNVSAMEGQFYRRFKTDKHPHTNMAKAALNMMTRTSAPDYARDGIYMNSVDTGWVTDEDAAPLAERKRREIGFNPPLDIVDGAARIVDPIFDGINTGRHVWGQFLKDYRPTVW